MTAVKVDHVLTCIPSFLAVSLHRTRTAKGAYTFAFGCPPPASAPSFTPVFGHDALDINFPPFLARLTVFIPARHRIPRADVAQAFGYQVRSATCLLLRMS